MLKYKITNRFIRDDTTFVSQNTINRGVLTDVSVISKEITVPFVTQTKDTGYSDLISELFTVEKNKNVTSFLFQGEMPLLLKELSQLPVEKITITEPDLEEVFMHYYESDSREGDN